MKKSYQTQKGRALRRFEAVAEQQPVLQLVLPIAALGEQMHSGLMRLAKRLSVGCLEQMMAWDVEHGPRFEKVQPGLGVPFFAGKLSVGSSYPQTDIVVTTGTLIY